MFSPTTTSIDSYRLPCLIMQTRSTLGKRGHQDSSSPAVSLPVCDQLQTPENTPNPKRIRTIATAVDGDSNKENIPPFKGSSVTADSPRAVRALRRTATEYVSPARSRPGTSTSAKNFAVANNSSSDSKTCLCCVFISCHPSDRYIASRNCNTTPNPTHCFASFPRSRPCFAPFHL